MENYLLISAIYNSFCQYISVECNNNIVYYIIDTIIRHEVQYISNIIETIDVTYNESVNKR